MSKLRAERGLPKYRECEDCYPQLLPENYDAFTLWQLVQGQVIIAGMGEVIGLDHPAIWKDIDEYEKEFGRIDRWKNFNKLIQLFYHMRDARNKWAEEEKAKQERLEFQKKIGVKETEELYNSSPNGVVVRTS